MLVPINLTGGTYKHKSLPVSAQSTINLVPVKQTDEKAFSTYILDTFPGKKSMPLTGYWTGVTAQGADRGLFEHQGLLYHVAGESLLSVDTDGLHTFLGSIPGAGRCIFAPSGTNIVISTDGVRYQWNGTTVATISDGDLETGNSAAHLNSQILYDGLNGRFCSSDVGDATSINALNYATAESDADLLLRVYTFNQVAFMMGEKTIEPWYNSGQGNPPFDRYEGAQINVGLGAIHSVANDDDSVYFLGDDFQVYVMRGGASSVIAPVTTAPMVKEFRDYSDVSDAIGWCMNMDGQWQYHLTFPTANKTWVYIVGGEWFQLSSGSSGGRDRSGSYAFCFGKHIIADYETGEVYELDSETYADVGEEIIRTRDSAPIHGGLIQKPGKSLTMNKLEIFLEAGVGLVSPSAQGYDPEIMVSFSDDGGHTFSEEIWAKVGRLGEFQKRVEFNALGTFTERIIRLRMSDPVHWCVYSAAAEIEVGI